MSNFVNKRTVKVTFDYSGTDSAGVSNATKDLAHPTGVFIPDNAIITSAFYEVISSFTSATNACTIACHVESGDDLVLAIAIDDVSAVWTAGIHGTLVKAGTGANDAAHDSQVECIALDAAAMVKIADHEEVTFTLGATEDLTAGRLNLWIDYVIGE